MKKKSFTERVVELSCRDHELGALSVSKIAVRFQVSESFLHRQFRMNQYTIGKYLFRERMFRAALLISSKRDLTIKSLSEGLGFDDYDYFRRVFRRFFGVAPSQYRRCKAWENDD